MHANKYNGGTKGYKVTSLILDVALPIELYRSMFPLYSRQNNQNTAAIQHVRSRKNGLLATVNDCVKETSPATIVLSKIADPRK